MLPIWPILSLRDFPGAATGFLQGSEGQPGIYSSMNLSFQRGDRKEDVEENYRRISRVIGFDLERTVCSQQTHTVNIRQVGRRRRKGVLRPLDYQDVDGLITDIPGMTLAASFADCVPLFFVDPVHKAVGLAHSGWRGTAGGWEAIWCRP